MSLDEFDVVVAVVISLPDDVESLPIVVVSDKVNERSPMVPAWVRVVELSESVDSLKSPVTLFPLPVLVIVEVVDVSPVTFRSVFVSERSSVDVDVIVDELV